MFQSPNPKDLKTPFNVIQDIQRERQQEILHPKQINVGHKKTRSIQQHPQLFK